MRGWLTRGILALALLAGLSAALVARVVTESREELARSDAAFDRGELRPAVVHARRAATLAPRFTATSAAARARLLAVAVGSEARGDVEVARLAWRSIRGVILETRTIGALEADALAVANQSLARLAAHDVPRERALPMRDRFEALLERDDAPRPGWGALVTLGLALSLFGLVLVTARGLRADGTPIARPAALGVAVGVAGAVLWTFALWQA